MTIGAVLSFDSLGYALIFPAVYLGFGTLEGNFITPWVMGRSLTLNPVLILFSLYSGAGCGESPASSPSLVPILAAFKIFLRPHQTNETAGRISELNQDQDPRILARGRG